MDGLQEQVDYKEFPADQEAPGVWGLQAVQEAPGPLVRLALQALQVKMVSLEYRVSRDVSGIRDPQV